MKTALELIKENYPVVKSKEDTIAMIQTLMETYAYIVSKQALQKAADNAKIKKVDHGSFGINSYEYEVDKYSILDTQIITP